jgi:hypothetical protein
MMRRLPSFIVAAAAVLGIGRAAAGAPVGETCATAYEQGQQLLRQGALIRSRADLRLCQSSCPTALVQDCSMWLTELEQQVPSLQVTVLEANGVSPAKVRVLVDGVLIGGELTDAPLDVDPGKHTLRFEDQAGRHAEAKVELMKGEKSVPLTVRLPAAAPPPSAPATSQPVRRPPAPVLSPIIWFMGGAGIAALLTGGGLGLKGHVERLELIRDRCGTERVCEKARIDTIRTEWLAGGVAAGVGVVVLGAAALTWYATRPPHGAAAPVVSLRIDGSGYGMSAAASIEARF